MKRILLALATIALCSGAAHAQAVGDPAVLDSLQYTGFNYFWSLANPANGLCPDRSTAGSVCSIASTGFGLSAICVGADHGWIQRFPAGAVDDRAKADLPLTVGRDCLIKIHREPPGKATQKVSALRGVA